MAENLTHLKVDVRMSVLSYINHKLQHLESKAKGIVCVLQFAPHPDGLAMILRMYHGTFEKEFSFPDVITFTELNNIREDKLLEMDRIDILFDTIHEALNKIQTISPEMARKVMFPH